MLISIIIATAYSIGFFFESIIGFGGGLIAYSILSFFMDVKTMIIAGLYIGTMSSIYIIYTDFRSFDKKIFLKILPLTLVGTMTGVLIFSKINMNVLGLILGLLLLFLSFKLSFLDKYKIPKILQNKLLVIGGISHGAFGIGGPFLVSAVKNDFKNKSYLRTTMACCFVFFNIVRFIQLSVEKQINFNYFQDIYWTIIPVFCAIYLGYKMHLKISEKLFKNMISILILISGIQFLVKYSF